MRRFNPLKWIGGLVSRLRSRQEVQGFVIRLSPGERAGVLLESCLCIRTGQFGRAHGLLLQLGERDAARLNLLGVICELRRDWRQARRFYGRSIRADRRFAPAQQNMRRWYELVTLGASELPILLGDEEPHWWNQRLPATVPEKPNHRITGDWLVATADAGNHDAN